MGDQAEMMLDGTNCEWCGGYIGDPIGYPRKCKDCANESRKEKRKVKAGRKGKKK